MTESPIVYDLGHTAAERQATLDALGATFSIEPVTMGEYIRDWEEVETLLAADRYRHRVTRRMQRNDPLALSACLNLASGAGGIGE